MEVVYGKFSDIYSICDIKEKLSDSAILDLLAPSVFNPTPERLLSRAEKYQADDNTSVYAYSENVEYKGIVVFKIKEQTVEILDIAVKPEYQGKGIGSRLIDYIFSKFSINKIIAETDDEAIGFYKKYGFTVIDTRVEIYTKRYTCVKNK
ncbi:MAG: GNAT family N-acetyltransferase [Acutalibacteraceae bacterium]|nr:GNAT family N-acetyltransferase [Acutalibacteraceae bacterium]